MNIINIYLYKAIVLLCLFKSLLSIVFGSTILNLTIFIIISFLFIRLNLEKFRYNFNLILIFIISFQVALSFFYLSPDVSFNLIFISYAQLLFPLLLSYITFYYKKNELELICNFIYRIVIVLIIYEFIEIFLLTNDFKIFINNILFNAKNGVDIEITFADLSLPFLYEYIRPGSLIFDPLAFGNILALTFAYALGKKNINYLVIFLIFLGSILSLIKSSILLIFFVLYLFFFKSKKLFLVTNLLIIVFLIFFIFFNFEYLLHGNSFEGYESVSNHLIGLVNGINSGLESPFFGHGYGKAGFLVYLNSLNTFGHHFLSIDEYFKLGNESAVGVLIYQMGFIFVFLLFYKLIELIRFFLKYNNFSFAAIMSGLIFFSFLSESILSFSIIVVIIPFTSYYIIYHLNMDNINE